jgi:hypothetical protein
VDATVCSVSVFIALMSHWAGMPCVFLSQSRCTIGEEHSCK